jgi:hypothetical protein
MANFPNFSDISDYATNQINYRIKNPTEVNGLNAWIRIASGVGDGLAIYSNPDFSLFSAAGDAGVGSIYGSTSTSGTIGVTWDGKPVTVQNDTPFHSKPNITSIEIEEGGMGSGIARKANLSITAYTIGQLNELTKYFLEPGFTIFIEWGWNRPAALIPFGKLGIDYIANNQSYEYRNDLRRKSKGLYDNYLGYITGGDIQIGDSTWTIKVKCVGFTELPSYFLVADTVKDPNKTPDDKNVESSVLFEPAEISSESELGKKRFMMMFNQLPTTRRTLLVKNLINDKEVAHTTNFINFDDSVRDALNSKTQGSFFGLVANDVKVGNQKLSVPAGTQIVTQDKFIRFGTLMKIINSTGVDYYMVGNKKVSTFINSSNTVITAFPRIFSANKSKLFIPNQLTPKFDLADALKNSKPQVNYSANLDNRVYGDGKIIEFPNQNPIKDGVAAGRQLHYKDETIHGTDVGAWYWGFLDDLYVNFDFVKGILETKNLLLKDALYQILNGMASAAGGIWDFQIYESNTLDGKSTELAIFDLNLQSEKEPDVKTVFNLYGLNSVFMDASLDFNIGQAKMDQIIGERLGVEVNGSQPDTVGKLFAKGLKDKILTKLNKAEELVEDKTKGNASSAKDSEEEKNLKQKNLEIFLQKVGIFPKVYETKESIISGDIEKVTYIASLDDIELFDNIKSGSKKKVNKGSSILFDIDFSFTIHGVSGIKHGDKFRVMGLPSGYETDGFFQITSVKHEITDMTWKTMVTGKFRQIKF